ncbi:ABC-type transport system involved in multi-copper enzyme maturation permease subunit [Streptomyces sp. Ag82_O1-15]|uniref:ABC transporter permease subunit n=1 Tax=Streptomyces sp. Ag82_O1-15 TaxID=1938855 RepID=UPI000BB14150|nr:ABC transporter permease subunit [Streptomyces sp. Ag82_O1-15]PBC95950.1 ABC-type transport system involved in multi-copper enzyme maturation permease subunit [Streptomyces sp. Ag82_O1-15]
MTSTFTPYRSPLKPAREGFARLLRAEWSKFWTVRVWVLALVVAAAVTVAISQLAASGSVDDSNEHPLTVGPDGTRVNDSFHYVHQSLPADGGVTVRVSDLKGGGGRDPEPWAKAGVLVKASTKAGSPYAALMLTPDHGVRLQWNFTHDKAGSAASGTAPHWLRMTRSGTRLTGYESSDGAHWTKVGSVTLPELPNTAQAGLFVATPQHNNLRRSFGGTSVTAGSATAGATFDHLALSGATATGSAAWTSTDVGAPDPNDPNTPQSGPARAEPGTTTVSATGVYTLTGQGDIAPDETGGDMVQMSFQGVFVAVLFMVALGALFITTEYKRGMIRTTFTATPRRVRVLTAKALVIGGVTFAISLPATAIAFLLAQSTMRSHGFAPPAYPDLSLLDSPALRAVVGSAALLSLVAVLALALGAILRNSAGAITAVVVLVILPQILAFALPLPVGHWLLRATPAAAFAVQQGKTYYPQVQHICLPESGCYPMAPWSGFAVLCAYAAVALALAAWRLRRRDV